MTSSARQLEDLRSQAQCQDTTGQGTRLHWRCWAGPSPDAPRLLLVHGGFGSWTHWAANIDALSRHYTVWTVDLPGLGASDDLPPPVSVAAIAACVLSGWNQLQGEDAAFEIAGFSFGAMVAGQLAAVAGRRCQRCVLIGAVGFGALQVQVPLLAPPSADVAPARAAVIHRENLARLMLHDPGRIDDLAVLIHADNLARARFNSRRLAVSNALAETLPAIEAQLVGIWGEQDATAGGRDNILERRALFRQAQPGAAFHLLPGVGHWAMYEAPGAVLDCLLGR